ncbi:MAG: SH3 domain-containing protein, partial [Enterococcus faecalis]|nr:SH3 domain-containing protein [Enterococcus faecalis]
IYPTPDALINEHLLAEALWTQVGTITAKLPDRQNLYRIENSGHLLGYVNDGDIAELWHPQTKKSFLIGVDEGIVLRTGQPSLSAPIYGIWPKNTRFYYDAFYIADGYVFIGGTDTSGARIYLPIGPNDGNAQNTWGSFTS